MIEWNVSFSDRANPHLIIIRCLCKGPWNDLLLHRLSKHQQTKTSPPQDYTKADNHTTTHEKTPGFKPFAKNKGIDHQASPQGNWSASLGSPVINLQLKILNNAASSSKKHTRWCCGGNSCCNHVHPLFSHPDGLFPGLFIQHAVHWLRNHFLHVIACILKLLFA